MLQSASRNNLAQPPVAKVRPARSQAVLLTLIAFLLIVSFFAGFIIAISITARYTVTRGSNTAASLAEIPFFDDKLYIKVWEILKNDYVDKNKVSDEKLFYGALKGMVAAVGDPYTVFFDPKDNEEFQTELSGSFEGIGAEIGMKDDRLTVIAPLADTPAEKAGLKAGDIILTIDGNDTADMSIDQAISLIRGKAGTIVKLNIYRQLDGQNTHEIPITREKISVPSVKSTVDTDGIATVRIANFNSDAPKQFFTALNTLTASSVRGLIIDLRNNPGGFLDGAVAIAGAWVDEGQLVVREVSRNPESSKEYRAEKQLRAPKVPTVVLINRGSASASEILAGALQDYGFATIVGSPSYGKGSVQDLLALPEGSGLKITISRWVTPKGRLIEGEGIIPDVEAVEAKDQSGEANDFELDKAKEIIKSKI